MPQEYTHLLNRTVTAQALSDTASPPDSLSVRLHIPKWSYAEVFGIAWGIKFAAEAALTAFDFAELHVLQGEIFQVGQTYRILNLPNKNIIWSDALSREHKFVYRDFSTPMRLEGGSDYLIVFSAPRAEGAGGTLFDCMLTVRGAIRSYSPPGGEARGAEDLELHAGGFS